jgi:hypothetical protein
MVVAGIKNSNITNNWGKRESWACLTQWGCYSLTGDTTGYSRRSTPVRTRNKKFVPKPSRNRDFQALCFVGVAITRSPGSALSAIRALLLLGVAVPSVLILGVVGCYAADASYTSYGLQG